MPEKIYEFKEGPYDVLEFEVFEKDDKVIVDINGGDLGRLPIESLKTVEELRNSLDRIEKVLEEKKRRQEEF
jgi:hypothetical protein